MATPSHQISSRRKGANSNEKSSNITVEKKEKNITPNSTNDAKLAGDEIAKKIKTASKEHNGESYYFKTDDNGNTSWNLDFLEVVDKIKSKFNRFDPYQAMEFTKSLSEPFGRVHVFQEQEIHEPISVCTMKSHARSIHECSSALALIVPLSNHKIVWVDSFKSADALIDELSKASSQENYFEVYGSIEASGELTGKISGKLGNDVGAEASAKLKSSHGAKYGRKYSTKDESKHSTRKTTQSETAYHLCLVQRVVLKISDEYIEVSKERGYMIRPDKADIDYGPFWPDYSILAIENRGTAKLKAKSHLERFKADRRREHINPY